MGEFTLDIKGGEFTDSEIMVMLGENGKLLVLSESRTRFQQISNLNILRETRI